MKYVLLTSNFNAKLFLGRLGDFWTKKFTQKTESLKFLTSQPLVVLQDIKKSFEDIQLDVRIY